MDFLIVLVLLVIGATFAITGLIALLFITLGVVTQLTLNDAYIIFIIGVITFCVAAGYVALTIKR